MIKQFSRSSTLDADHHTTPVEPDCAHEPFDDLLLKYNKLQVDKDIVEEAFNKAKADLENIEEESERRETIIVALTDQNHNHCDQIQALMLKVANVEKK